MSPDGQLPQSKVETYADEGDGVFACDVAKSCHHGSEDVSFRFLKAMEPAATVISSGDAEGRDHPRPRVVAASGVTGHVTVDEDRLLTPLVNSTEIARSYELGHVNEARPIHALTVGLGLHRTQLVAGSFAAARLVGRRSCRSSTAAYGRQALRFHAGNAEQHKANSAGAVKSQ